MGLQLKNKKELVKYIQQQAVRIETALIFQLEYLVAELQNHAKQSAEYIDQTSNLKGSIGGVVLKNGKPVFYKGFDSGGSVGNSTGLEFLNSLIAKNPTGYVILIVAGMEYATYVENYHGLNVLKKSELKMEREIPALLNRLKTKIEKL